MTSIFASDSTADLSADSTIDAQPHETGQPELSQSVGAVLLRRIKYIGRFVYWTARHRSTKHVAWVLAYEGYTWN